MSAGHQWLQITGNNEYKPLLASQDDSLHLNDIYPFRKSEQGTLYNLKVQKLNRANLTWKYLPHLRPSTHLVPKTLVADVDFSML